MNNNNNSYYYYYYHSTFTLLYQSFMRYLVHFIYCNLLLHHICAEIQQQQQKDLFYAINEESDIGTFVGNIKLDLEHKYLINIQPDQQFEIYPDQLVDKWKLDLFQIERNTGKLFVQRRIDRELICTQTSDDLTNENDSGDTECRIHLTVCIGRIHWINVIITVHDINDHAPYFPLNNKHDTLTNESKFKLIYQVNVSESVSSGYEIPLITARDPDQGMNSVQTYNLRGIEFDPSTFTIMYRPPYTLNLVILRELDAETKNLYTGELICCDGGQPIPKCVHQPFHLHVTDVNDNKPLFSKTVYEVEVFENILVNTTLIQLNATDADDGLNGQLIYAFGYPSNQVIQKQFGLNAQTGEVYLKSELNAREHSLHVIHVQVKDRGPIPFVAQSMIRVFVRDVNDHAPWIEIRSINNNEYDDIDYKNKESFNSYESNETVTDQVRLAVKENEPINTHIGLLIAGDDDIGNNSLVTCFLPQNSNKFLLNHANSAKGREIYKVITNETFDRELIPSGLVQILIQCNDKGDPVQSVRQLISVRILDVNEYRPKFSPDKQLVSLQMPENQPLDTYVAKIIATDEDHTPEIQYYLSQEAQTYFQINEQTGEVTTRAVLDRETIPNIRFLIYAKDNYTDEYDNLNTLPSVANVTLVLTDINDNSPELVGLREFQIVENRPGFSDLVGQLTAVDQDVGNNGTVRYKLLSVNSDHQQFPNEWFMINSETGKIFVTKKLDREQHSQYQLTVLIYDLGTPVQRSTTETIVINVLDENDNPPEWGVITYASPTVEQSITDQTKYTQQPHLVGMSNVKELGALNITNPLYRGQQILILTATDEDADYNSNITFHIVQINLFDDSSSYLDNPKFVPINYFTLATKTGELIVGPGSKGIGLNENGVFQLYLRVTDNGNPPLYANARLYLLVSISDRIGYESYQNEKGLFSYLLTTGQLGIGIIILLILILCLTSICLIIAFVTIRRKQQSTINRTDNANQRKLYHNGNCTYALQMNGELSPNHHLHHHHENEMNMPNLGNCYHSPILNTMCTDNMSLYKWTPECNHGNLVSYGQTPIYNFCALNATLDRVKSNQRDLEENHTLTMCGTDYTGTINQYYDEKRFTPDHHTTMNHMRSPVKLKSDNNYYSQNMINTTTATTTNININTSTNAVNNTCYTELANQSNMNEQPHSNNVITVSEIDGNSADSGQGVSEDEPTSHELFNHNNGNGKSKLKFLPINISKEHLISEIPSVTNVQTATTTSTRCLPESNMFQLTNKNAPNTLHNASNNLLNDKKDRTNIIQSSISTFTSQKFQQTPTHTKVNMDNITEINNNDSEHPRWCKPLFSNTDIGHHNQLFDDSVIKKPPTLVRQSSTLPIGIKSNNTTRMEVGNYSPKLNRTIYTNQCPI